MSPEQFIRNNVVKTLQSDGYTPDQAERGGMRQFLTTAGHPSQQRSAEAFLMTALNRPEPF